MTSPYTIEQLDSNTSPATIARLWAGDFAIKRNWTSEDNQLIVSLGWTTDHAPGTKVVDVLRRHHHSTPFRTATVTMQDQENHWLQGTFSGTAGIDMLASPHIRQSVAKIALWGSRAVVMWTAKEMLARSWPAEYPAVPHSYMEISSLQSTEEEALHMANSFVTRIGTFAIMRHGTEVLEALMQHDASIDK